LCIPPCDNPLQALVDFVYLDIVNNIDNRRIFEEKPILAPTLDYVEHVNEYVLSLIQGEAKEYLSSDTACKSDEDWYPRRLVHYRIFEWHKMLWNTKPQVDFEDSSSGNVVEKHWSSKWAM